MTQDRQTDQPTFRKRRASPAQAAPLWRDGRPSHPYACSDSACYRFYPSADFMLCSFRHTARPQLSHHRHRFLQNPPVPVLSLALLPETPLWFILQFSETQARIHSSSPPHAVLPFPFFLSSLEILSYLIMLDCLWTLADYPPAHFQLFLMSSIHLTWTPNVVLSKSSVTCTYHTLLISLTVAHPFSCSFNFKSRYYYGKRSFCLFLLYYGRTLNLNALSLSFSSYISYNTPCIIWD